MACSTGYANFKNYADVFQRIGFRTTPGFDGIFAASPSDHRIYKIRRDGVMIVFAGSGTAGYLDGTGSAAQFNKPGGITYDRARNVVIVSDNGNNRIRKITAAGVVTTFAGSGVAGYLDATGTAAQFNLWIVSNLTIDAMRNIYVADSYNHCIRKITTSGVVTTLIGKAGTPGAIDAALGQDVRLNFPIDVCYNLYGDGEMYVADHWNGVIRKVDTNTTRTKTLGNESHTASMIYIDPLSITVDNRGNLYIVGINDSRISIYNTLTAKSSTLDVKKGSYGLDPGAISYDTFTNQGTTQSDLYISSRDQTKIYKYQTLSSCLPICDACPNCISQASGGSVNYNLTSSSTFTLYDLKTNFIYCSSVSQSSPFCSALVGQGSSNGGPYIYGVNGTGGACYTIGTSTRCFGGNGGSIRGSASNGGGDGLYIDFIDSKSKNENMSGKPGTGGGGGGGLSFSQVLNPGAISDFFASFGGTINFKWVTVVYENFAVVNNTPGSGGSGIAILSYLSSEECPADLPFYNFDLLSPVCTICLQYNSSTPLFDYSTGLCTSCPAGRPYYDPSTKTCVATCPVPMSPNPLFNNVCAIPPLTCQGARPYFNGYECASSQVNFSTQGGATGGNTVINNGSYVIHIFTSSGTFTPPVDKVLTGDILIVGGGGGGGTYSIESTTSPRSAGGGGGGDVQYSTGISFGQQSWTVTIGQGGNPNRNGGNSSFGTYVAAGGGSGSAYPDIVDASNGASGGGGSGIGQIGYATAGFSGGNGSLVAGSLSTGGGGGGKTVPGSDGLIDKGGNGGNGATNSITGTSTYYGGGGGGSAVAINKTYVAGGTGGTGGLGGGGAGASSVVYNYLNYQKTNMVRGENGTPNTGGGGGGGAAVASPGPGNYNGNPVTNPGSSGGSGIVIVRYSTTGLCPSNLPYFNPGLKTCTNCPDTAPQYLAGVCAKCPASNPYWNGIACVAACPAVLPRADKNNVCQLPCSGASPNWDSSGGTCVTTCPDTAPIASGGVCGSCPGTTPYWNPVTKMCVTGCPESRQNSVCKTCYDIDSTKPYWNGSACAPCPDATPAWTGPLTACQACPVTNPVWDATSKQCKTCYAINPLRPFYNKTPGGYSTSSINRCQPCQLASTPSWNNILKVCQTCIAATSVSTPYWSTVTNACTACPASSPYWNSRVCALPKNIITIPLTATTTGNVTASATTSVSLPWKAFDGSSTTYWQSDASYTANGTYNGKRSTRDSGNTLWNGEFLQVEFPYSYIISSYTLTSTNLLRWVVLGSGDGFIWDLIDNKTTSDVTNYSQTFYITPPLSNSYPLYRLVATKSSATSVSVTEWSPQTANAVVTTQTSQQKSALTVISGSIQGCDNVACVIDKSSSTDITDLVYGNYPASQIGTNLLPDKAQEALSNCSSNVDCGFVQFNFLSNVSNFSTSAPYTVSTMTTTMSDVGLFQKKYGVTPPPRLRAPPGLAYNYSYIEGTRLGSNLTATVDVCGQACTKNPACKGFNFYYASSNCEFYSTISSSDKYDPNKGSFVRDSHILTGAKNTDRLSYTDLNESGSTCQNMTACNADVSSLIGQLGSTIQSFSTAELDSCNYCPIRSVAKQGSVYTVTNEVDIASNVATTVDVQSKMRFSNVNTTTHTQLPDGNYTIRSYVSPASTATVNIRNQTTWDYYTYTQYRTGVQLWIGNEPFAAGIAPKSCLDSGVPGGNGMRVSDFFPLYSLGTTLKNSRGEVCVTTEKGTYTHQACVGGQMACSTGTDLDPGIQDVTTGKNTRGGGNPDLLNWEFIPVDWVKNGYYIRSKGSEKRLGGFGPNYVKYDATSLPPPGVSGCAKRSGVKMQPYLKWGSYLGKVQDIGSSSNDQLLDGLLAFVSGVTVGLTGGMYDPNLPSKNDPSNVFFTSFPPQFQAMDYPCNPLYTDLQTLPSQGPGGSKYDDKEYIFVIEPV